eukprot:3736772-Rhodomonas_salina.1
MRLTLDSTIDQRMLPLTLGKDTFDSEAELHAAVLCASLCELVPFPEKFDLAFEEEDDADEEDEDEAEQEQQEQQAQEEQEQEQEETGGRKRVAQRRAVLSPEYQAARSVLGGITRVASLPIIGYTFNTRCIPSSCTITMRYPC